MGKSALVAVAMVASLLTSGCAGNRNDDVGGALLLGAAVVGLGLLAASGSDDDEPDYRDRRYERRHERRHDRYDSGYGGYEERSYARNGQCDDARYRTSNGGRAAAGTDEWDCRRYGDGRK